jgi:ubiquinone/menaquinone biosynthesis C-methylase UbiE
VAALHDGRLSSVSILRACVFDLIPLGFPYASASFDGAYLIDVLEETRDGPAVLQELRRILRPDGRLIVGEHFMDPDFVSIRSLKERAQTAGFTFERKRGTSLAYLLASARCSSRVYRLRVG